MIMFCLQSCKSAHCIENCIGFSTRIRIVIYSLDRGPDCLVLRPYFGRKQRRGLSFLMFVGETDDGNGLFVLFALRPRNCVDCKRARIFA